MDPLIYLFTCFKVKTKQHKSNKQTRYDQINYFLFLFLFPLFITVPLFVFVFFFGGIFPEHLNFAFLLKKVNPERIDITHYKLQILQVLSFPAVIIKSPS